jgi:hypothetical protein
MTQKNEELPYIITERIVIDMAYNPNYGDHRMCTCGHVYYRHFDSYEDNEPAGCKYCGCFEFVEKLDNE